MRTLALLALAALAASLPADQTGRVQGRISAAPDALKKGASDIAVVWVEGVKDFKVPAERPSIRQADVQFNPSFLVVVAGQTVDMPNEDNVIHNVFSKSACCTFDLGFYPKGQSKSIKLEKTGVVELKCTLHKSMTATVFVVPNPFFAQVKLGSKFEIRGLPPGSYRLKAWNESLSEHSQEITVSPGGTVNADFALAAK